MLKVHTFKIVFYLFIMTVFFFVLAGIFCFIFIKLTINGYIKKTFQPC